MTERSDIMPRKNGWRRLSYTTRCGWVDWGHALPDGAKSLLTQIQSETGRTPGINQLDITLNGRAAYVLDYGQAMGGSTLGVSTTRHWVVRKGLLDTQKQRVALAIFMAASHQFERLQGSFPYSLMTDSSYSAEDLVSNLIGFYTALQEQNQQSMRALCGEVSVAESLRIWDAHLPNGLGGLKNRGTTPLLFPTEEGNGDTSFPQLFNSITPEPAGLIWVAPQGRFIDGRLVNARIPINVASDGQVTIRR